MPGKPRFFLKHWRAKIGSLVLASVLWFVIKQGITHPLLQPPLVPPNVLPPPRP